MQKNMQRMMKFIIADVEHVQSSRLGSISYFGVGLGVRVGHFCVMNS